MSARGMVSARSRRGAVAVEMAMVAPILFILMFGVVEFGMMFHCIMQLHNMAREGARLAAVGGQPAAVATRINSAGTLKTADVTQTLQYRVMAGTTWTGWTTLTAGSTLNNAPSGAEVRVKLDYAYHLATGTMFSTLGNNHAGTVRTLHASAIMRRE